MRSRSRYLRLLAVLLAFVLAGACENGGDEVIPVPDRAEGLITEIHPAEGAPESFRMEVEERTLEVLIAEDVDYGFDLEHLREHLAQDLPVIVELEERDGKAYATAIEDA